MTGLSNTRVGDLIDEFKEQPARDHDLPVLTLTERNGFVYQGERFSKRLATENTSKYKVVRHNDLAFNPYLLWAGAVAQNTIVEAGIISPLYPTFRVRSDFDPRFVARLLLTEPMIARYDTIAFGSVPRRRRSSVKDFLALPVGQIPSLPEQRRIADILDQADALRAKRRETLRLLDDLTQSIFFDMFGDVEATIPLAERVVEFRYGTSTKSAPDGVPTLRIPNVVGGGLDLEDMKSVPVTDKEFDRLRLRDGDVLFVRTNGNPGNVGRCAYFDSSLVSAAGLDAASCVYASYLIRARLEGTGPAFVTNYLATAAGRKQLRDRSKTSAGQYNINIKGLSSVLIPDVPYEQQGEFAQRTEQVRSHRATVRRADAELDALFASLQQRAFSGQL